MKKYREKYDFSMLIAVVIVTLIFISGINVIKTPYYSDELGYWAAGAWISGIDWSPIFSHSLYYGWGYGIILAPLFFITNSTLRFQVAIMINLLLIIGCFFLLTSINKKFFPKVKEFIILIISGVTILYSYNIVYAHTTMCEVFLTFLFLLSIRFLICLCEKVTIKNILLFSVVLIMQLATHLRTIVFIFALVLTICYLIYYREISYRNIVILAGLVFVGIIITFIVKNRLIASQYINISAGANITRPAYNDSFVTKFALLKSFFSFEGWEKLFYSIIGKWFYLSCASLFLVCIGLRYLICEIVMSLKNNKKFEIKNAVFVYILIFFVCSFLLGALHLMYPSRFDHVLYGRYTENMIPIIISIGLLRTINGDVRIKEINEYILCSLIMSVILYHFMKKQSFINTLPLEISVFAGILTERDTNYDIQFTIYAAMIMILISILFYIIIKKNAILACAFLAVIWTLIAYRGLKLCIYPELERQEYIIEAAKKLDTLDKRVCTLIYEDVDKNITAYVDILWLQFHLGKKTIYEVTMENIDSLDEDDVLVISNNYPYAEIIAKQYSPSWINNQMYIIETQSLKDKKNINE